MLVLVLHSIMGVSHFRQRRLCGTTASAPASVFENLPVEEVKKGVRAWKEKHKQKAEEGGSGVQAGADRNVLRDIRELSHIPPSVHALVDQLCQTFEKEGDEAESWAERCKVDLWDVPSLRGLGHRGKTLPLSCVFTACVIHCLCD